MLMYMNDTESKTEYGCFFCKTGYELLTAQEIEQLVPMSRSLVPMKLRYRRINGVLQEEKVILFPGYVFVQMPVNSELFELLRKRIILTILRDSDDDWRLKGTDRAFADELFRCNGVFGFSKAFYENDRIHVVEGPLANYNGQILRVNRRKQTAEVQMSCQGVIMRVWLGFELIEPTSDKQGTKE